VPPPDPKLASSAAGGTHRPRVLLYSHDGTGLGHLRIMLGIAHDLAPRRPDATFLLLTGSLQTHAFELPSNLDYVKLPSMPRRRLYEGLPTPPAATSRFKNVVYFREAVARATVEAFAPQLIVIDHAPAGLFGELAAALEWLHAATPRAEIVFLMRDITFGPEQTRKLWGEEGAFDLLDRVFDRILVYGSREIFDPIVAYGLSPAAAAKTSFCGYLRPPSPTRSPADIRAELNAAGLPLVVVTVGGGADGGNVLRTYLDALRLADDADLVSYVVTGPLLDAAERDAITARGSHLPNVTLVPFSPDLISYLHAADVIVTMGGYNAVCEAVAAGKRPIVIPRAPGSEEQVIRADRFARRHLVTAIPPGELTPDRLWHAVREELARGTSPPGTLPFNGRERIVEVLINALTRYPIASLAG
jgi:predicted glycosyltransferase